MMSILLNNQFVKYFLVFLSGCLLTIIFLSKDSDSNREKQLVLSYEERMSKKEAEIEQLRFLQQEKVSRLEKEKSEMEISFKEKIQALVTENQSLKKSVEKVVIETRKPDGTIEKKTVSKEILEKESQKIAQIQKETDQKIAETRETMKKEYEFRISEINKNHELEKQQLIYKLEKSEQTHKESIKSTTKFSLGIGKKSDMKNTALLEYTFYGPLFMGTTVDFKSVDYDSIGVLLGVRF